jgi:hypothetical protein
MSDDNNGELTKPKNEANESQTATPAASEAKPASRRSRATLGTSLSGLLNSDLQNALQSWDNVTEQVAKKVSPEQAQLREVKKILSDLKSKLEEFDDK